MGQIIAMKKEKQASPAKAARKAIQQRLIKELTSIAAQLNKQGIHTDIDFEKESKKLAKKITKGAKVDQPAAEKEASPAKVEAPAKVSAAKPKAAAKPAAPKAAKVVVPATTPEPAASKPAKTAPKKNAEKK